jgi:hypothetical protein
VNPGGLVIAIAGVWLGCQIFGGNMLQRLGIIATDATPPNYKPGVGGTADHPQTSGG